MCGKDELMHDVRDREREATKQPRRRLPELLERLRERYTHPAIPPCRVCGAPLEIGAVGGGNPTEWYCSAAAARLNERAADEADRAARRDHFSDSRHTQRIHGDSDVLELLQQHEATLAALVAFQAELATLREALYPFVVACLEADAHEDAPEIDGAVTQVGMRALPECPACTGHGSTDHQFYEDRPIPAELVCPDCKGWGFLKQPAAEKVTS